MQRTGYRKKGVDLSNRAYTVKPYHVIFDSPPKYLNLLHFIRNNIMVEHMQEHHISL